MNFKEYKENVKRTLPELGDWKGNVVILDSLHMVLGMFSEVYELNDAIDDTNKREEITDILWYAANYANVRHIEVPEDAISYDNELGNNEDNFDSYQGLLINCISELQDYDKKEFAYGRSESIEVMKKRHELIVQILSCLDFMYYYAGFNAEEAMEQNINKLKQRYPDKFDADKALNRNLEEERKHLEN